MMETVPIVTNTAYNAKCKVYAFPVSMAIIWMLALHFVNQSRPQSQQL